jgi:putative peptidoglycan lipid II flippase
MFKLFIKNGKNLLTKEQSDILSASAVMMLLILVAKVLGMFTKTVAVSQLGTEKYGLFIAANTLPEMISMILIFGSITSVIIPILVEEIQKSDVSSFSKLFSSLVNTGLAILIIFTIILIVIADRITPIIIERIANPVKPFTSEQILQVSSMMKILMMTQVILGVSTLLSSALNAYKRFIVPQLAPIFYNIGILFGAIFIIPILNKSPWGLVIGVLIGSILHLLIQIPLIAHLKIKFQFIFDLTNKKLRNIIFIAFPRILTLASDQFAIFIDRIIAIGLGAAPLGAYHLAVSLVTIPYSLFSSTFSMAALPYLSSEYSKGNIDKFKSIFIKIFNQILFLTVPVSFVLLVLRLPIVRLLYGIFGREFTWGNTLMVSWVVFFFSLGLIPEVLASFLNRAFYAMCDTIRPLIVGVFVVIGGIITGIYFTNYFSHFSSFSLKELYWNPEFFLTKEKGIAAIGGIAFSSSIIYSLSFIILVILLLLKIGKLDIKSFWLAIIRKIFSGFFMAVIMYILFKVWERLLDTAKTANVLILTISTIVPGVIIYIWLLYLLKDCEVFIIDRLIRYIKKLFIKFIKR